MTRLIHTTGEGTEHPVLQQVPVVPLDASGFTASVVGTIIFALATGARWWSGHVDPPLWTLVTGTALGSFLIVFTAWHRRRTPRGIASSPVSRTLNQ